MNGFGDYLSNVYLQLVEYDSVEFTIKVYQIQRKYNALNAHDDYTWGINTDEYFSSMVELGYPKLYK